MIEGVPPFDLRRIAEVMSRCDVRFVAIGGVSGMLHGVVEYLTQDVDLLVEREAENLHRVARALTELGARVEDDAGDVVDRDISAADFVGNSQWNTDAGPVDVIVAAAGPNETFLIFADIERRLGFFDVGEGLALPVASLDDVIRMKEAADRHKDHLALPELRRLRRDAHPERSLDTELFQEFDDDDWDD